MGLLQKVALVPEGVNIGASELTQVATALSKQVTRDFQPIWGVAAMVNAAATLDDVETDAWPIIIVQDVQNAAGYHTDQEGQPFALVAFSSQWPLTASHECLEMLADPFGERLVAADLLDQAIDLGLEPKRVRYLVEVCDPSEAGRFSYTVNGVVVSDFYTPNYFDPVQATGVRYSFTGALDSPRKVLDGGYISWQDPDTNHWMQLRMFADTMSSSVPHVVDLNTLEVFNELYQTQGTRAAIDAVTKPPPYRDSLHGPFLTAARTKMDTTAKARKARAATIRQRLAAIMGKSA
jgi:hypothetical protein